mgnify:CR=1 FL=1
MGLFDIFSGGPFDFNGDGKMDAGEMALGLMMMDEIGKEKERERRRQELVSDLLRNAAIHGMEYSPEEIEAFLADSEALGLLD